MRSRKISLLELKTACLDVAHYNNLILSVDNKARVLFSATARLIKAAFDSHGRDDLQIIVDRQGGRSHYRRNLQLMFPATELKIIHETEKLSSYEIAGSSRKMRIHFAVAADDRFMPVSLASMVSKYVRELLVENINSYFIARHTDLKPTSGYWTDGLRFIREIKANLPDLPIDEKQLIRSR
jgi:ribonuclease HII